MLPLTSGGSPACDRNASGWTVAGAVAHVICAVDAVAAGATGLGDAKQLGQNLDRVGHVLEERSAGNQTAGTVLDTGVRSRCVTEDGDLRIEAGRDLAAFESPQVDADNLSLSSRAPSRGSNRVPAK